MNVVSKFKRWLYQGGTVETMMMYTGTFSAVIIPLLMYWSINGPNPEGYSVLTHVIMSVIFGVLLASITTPTLFLCGFFVYAVILWFQSVSDFVRSLALRYVTIVHRRSK